MRKLFKKWKRPKESHSTTAVQPMYPPPAWPDINPQMECLLFSKLSAELRIQIYQAVLTCPERFIHIIKNRVVRRDNGKDVGRWVAHYWCDDMDSPFPTWQHTCYGESLDVRPGVMGGFCRRSITETNDQLLSFLLTCRIIYCQALPILYQENIYHFRGAPSLLALRTSISRIHWNLIRHIHLSTFYTCDAGWYIQDQCWPPENPINWEKMCEYIQELPQLDSLKLDIVFKITSGYAHLSHRMNNLFTRALGPLKNVKAKVFEVESNVQPAPEVWASLGRVNFKIVVRERELNERLYGGNPRLEISSRGNTVFVHKIPFCC